MVGGPGSLSGLTSAIANDIASKAMEGLQKADRDGSGSVTREEFRGGDEAFTLLDNDGNGVIDETDFQRMFAVDSESGTSPLQSLIEESMQRFVEGRDEDGDGLLSANEFGGDEREFQRIDRDEDGFLSASELASDFIEQRPELAVQVQLLDEIITRFFEDREESGGSSLRETAREQFEKFVTARDQDEDGGLSRDELGLNEQEFARLDTDDDGLVTAGELTQSFMDGIEQEDGLLTITFLEELMTRLNELTSQARENDTSVLPRGNSFDVTG